MSNLLNEHDNKPVGNDNEIKTSGGAFIEGNVATSGGDVVGRDYVDDRDTTIVIKNPTPSVTQRDNIAQIWTAVGLALLYVTVNALARTAWNIEGFFPPLAGLFNQYEPLAASVFGMLLGAPLLFIVLILAARYLLMSRGRKWYTKVPVAFRLSISPNTVEGKLYRFTFLTLFVFFPFIAQLHFLYKFFLAGQPNELHGAYVSHWVFDQEAFFRMWYTDSGYRYHGTEYKLIVEPALFAGLGIGLLVYLGLYCVRLLSSPD